MRETMTEKPKRACRWWQRHKWGTWTDRFKGHEKPIGAEGAGYPTLIQERRCLRCYELQFKTVRSYRPL